MRFKRLKGFVLVLFLLLIFASTDVIAVQRAKTQKKKEQRLNLLKNGDRSGCLSVPGLLLFMPKRLQKREKNTMG